MSLPQPNDPFEWTQAEWGAALRCRAIAAPHLFTTRALNLDSQPGWQTLARSIGASRVVRPRQVHGTAVAIVDSPAEEEDVCAQADIVATVSSGAAIAVQAADCVPMLFQDRRTGAVAAAHAGWRGSAAGVSRATVEAMTKRFGTKAADLVVALGPGIGPCCYEVGGELLDGFGQDGRRWFYRLADKLILNLWAANRDQLVLAGVPEDQVHVAGLCTAAHADLFPSYRRDGSAAGRLAAAIAYSRPVSR